MIFIPSFEVELAKEKYFIVAVHQAYFSNNIGSNKTEKEFFKNGAASLKPLKVTHFSNPLL